MSGVMGGIIGGPAFGMVSSEEDCWTPRGAVRRLLVHAVPFPLCVHRLSGLHSPWSGGMVGTGALRLLIGPINHVAKHIPGTAADRSDRPPARHLDSPI